MTKQLILDRALALFMDKGYEGASMNDIATAVGIRKSSLYAHFTGKEAIFAAIFEDILAEYVGYIDGLTVPRSGESALAHLERMFTDFILYCHENMKMYFWDRYFYYPPAFLKDDIQRRTQETQDVFLRKIKQCLERGVENGEIRPRPVADTALAYYYLMIGLSMSVKLYDRETLRRDTASAWGGLRAGLANER
jgi:AcrR family transcriptional regulator